MSDESRSYSMDFYVEDWPGPVHVLFQKVVKATPFFVAAAMRDALVAAKEEMDAAMIDGKLPDDFMPMALLNIPPQYLYGLVWVPERKKRPELTFRELTEELAPDELLVVMAEAIKADTEDEEEEPGEDEEASPLAQAESSSPTPRKTRSSPSVASSQDGPSTTSTSSRRASGAASAATSPASRPRRAKAPKTTPTG